MNMIMIYISILCCTPICLAQQHPSTTVLEYMTQIRDLAHDDPVMTQLHQDLAGDHATAVIAIKRALDIASDAREAPVRRNGAIAAIAMAPASVRPEGAENLIRIRDSITAETSYAYVCAVSVLNSNSAAATAELDRCIGDESFPLETRRLAAGIVLEKGAVDLSDRFGKLLSSSSVDSQVLVAGIIRSTNSANVALECFLGDLPGRMCAAELLGDLGPLSAETQDRIVRHIMLRSGARLNASEIWMLGGIGEVGKAYLRKSQAPIDSKQVVLLAGTRDDPLQGVAIATKWVTSNGLTARLVIKDGSAVAGRSITGYVEIANTQDSVIQLSTRYPYIVGGWSVVDIRNMDGSKNGIELIRVRNIDPPRQAGTLTLNPGDTRIAEFEWLVESNADAPGDAVVDVGGPYIARMRGDGFVSQWTISNLQAPGEWRGEIRLPALVFRHTGVSLSSSPQR